MLHRERVKSLLIIRKCRKNIIIREESHIRRTIITILANNCNLLHFRIPAFLLSFTIRLFCRESKSCESERGKIGGKKHIALFFDNR